MNVKEYIEARGKELKCDMNDVPEWVIDAAMEYYYLNHELNAARTLLGSDDDEDLLRQIEIIKAAPSYVYLIMIEEVKAPCWIDNMTCGEFIDAIS